MDVLEMVHPGTLLQQIEHQQSLFSSVFDSKCSSQWSKVGQISAPRASRKTVHTSSPNGKSKENIKYHGSFQQPDVTDLSTYLSLDASGANATSRSSLDPVSEDKSVKKFKKKKKKKVKNFTKSSENVSTEPLPTEHALDIAKAYSPSSKEGGNEKDEIGIANSGGPCDLTDNCARDVWNCNDGETILSGRFSNEKQGTEGPNTIENKSAMHFNDCCRKDFQDNISSIYMSGNKSYENDTNKCSSQFTSNSNVHAVDPSQHSLSSLADIVDKPRWDHNIRIGKENDHSIRQKSRKSFRDAPTHWVKRSNIHVQKDVSNALLPSQIVSSAHDIVAHGVEVVVKDKLEIPGRAHSNVMAESSRVIAQRLHGGLNQYDFDSGQDEVGVNLDWRKLKGTQNQSFKQKNFNNRKQNVGGHKSTVPGQSYVGTPPIPLDNWQRYHAHLDNKLSIEDNIRKDYASLASVQKWIPIGAKNSSMVKKHGSVGACNDIKVTLSSCKEKAEVHHGEHKICGCESVDPGKTCLISGYEIPTAMTVKSEIPHFEDICNKVEENYKEVEEIHKASVRDYVRLGNQATKAPVLNVGLQFALKALDAAYRLQIASESVQYATGSPLAEFERLVHSATPVISPAFSMQNCCICAGNQLSNSFLCKHQIPNIPLKAVWNWYEKPGSYGLEVMAHDIKNLKGFDIDSVSFSAHFVPFLSAVQLFGRSHVCKCSVRYDSELQEKRECKECSFSSKTCLAKPCLGTTVELNRSKGEESFLFKSGIEQLSSPDTYPASVNDSINPSSKPTYPDNMDLIFEFFEHEQPQQRKPLYDKIMELVKGGSSTYQVFGDPSKLVCMNLHDLHPASWYSVAWYPIYRIPEGSFRASFLTYHSLGHMVQQCSFDSHAKKQFSVVSPVLGLESYNTQGESWFCPSKPFEHSKSCTTFNSSKILQERLRALEETALLFARGSIYKDHIMVNNRQPDYEFFLSRKR